jgi:hypothetical protein
VDGAARNAEQLTEFLPGQTGEEADLKNILG